MPIVMQMSWSKIAKERYERLRTDVNWEGKVPRGAKLRVAYLGGRGFQVCDVWDSAQDFTPSS